MKKQNKQGISLIVLVITIIVMIILAASVVITLSNTGVIDRAGQAVDLTNKSQVQDLAALIWSEAYLDDLRGQDLIDEVEKKLEEQGVTKDNWDITITETGVNIAEKATSVELGTLIKDGNDYGKTINYEANGVTDWKVLYKTEEYVYIITSDILPNEKIMSEFITDSLATTREKDIYWDSAPASGTSRQLNRDLWLADQDHYDEEYNVRICSYLMDEYYWTGFMNSEYGENVVSAIGSPTLELITASWNKKRIDTNNTTIYEKEITAIYDYNGYKLNNDNVVALKGGQNDTLYALEDRYWLATPYYGSLSLFGVIKLNDRILVQEAHLKVQYEDNLLEGGITAAYPDGSLRPVVCLKASTPAKVGTTTDIELVK